MKTKTEKLLTGILVLQGLLLAGQWMAHPSAATARADNAIMNPSERQIQMIEELRTLNTKVDKLNATLTSGEITVKVAKDEK